VTIVGAINPQSGYVYDIARLKTVIKEEVTEVYDHRNLNLDTEDFKSLIPTVENMTVVIYNKVRKRIEPEFQVKVKLYETVRNYSEYPM
jgi:6-pyruvoyltetrahydropterin/6-carboxytetrahydropterin synthase